MPKEIEITIDEETLEFLVETFGFDGDECRLAKAEFLRNLQAEGVDSEEIGAERKLPQIRKKSRQKQKIGG